MHRSLKLKLNDNQAKELDRVVTHSTAATSSPLMNSVNERSERVPVIPSADVFLHQNRLPIFKSAMTRSRQMLRQKSGDLHPYEPYFTQSPPKGRSLPGFNVVATLVVSTSQPDRPDLLVYTKQRAIANPKAPKIILGKCWSNM
jgi:hypothetical protein